jgi:pyruvate formate lyase activating enzyme
VAPTAQAGRWAPGRRAGLVSSWDVSTGVDGPGTRLVVFISGCPLRCVYCQNPETWQMRDGRAMTVAAVLAELAKYERFIEASGGGFTVSGGEPLVQAEFVGHLLHTVKGRGVHTALDTSGYLGDWATNALLEDVDLVLLDIKSWDRATYHRVTGGDIAPTLRFARRLTELGKPVWVRFVAVPGWTDEEDNVDGVARFAGSLGNVERVDVLPFHRLALEKYAQLGIHYPVADVEPPSNELLERIRQQFRSQGLPTY